MSPSLSLLFAAGHGRELICSVALRVVGGLLPPVAGYAGRSPRYQRSELLAWLRRVRVGGSSIVPAQVACVVFWESLGYHNRGDPWREERYWGD
jgi:hypothetical protein